MPESQTQTLVANDAPPAAAPQQGSNPMFMMIAIVAIIYFVLIRPQQKEAKEHQALLSALKKGDRVVTTSGLHGRIQEVGDTTVVLEIADKVRVTVDKGSVKRRPGDVAADESKDGDKKDGDKKDGDKKDGDKKEANKKDGKKEA